MTATKREWAEAAGSDMPALSANARLLWVADEMYGHYTPLPATESVPDALTDYKEGYDAGDNPGPVDFVWRLYASGEEIDCGRFRFYPT